MARSRIIDHEEVRSPVEAERSLLAAVLAQAVSDLVAQSGNVNICKTKAQRDKVAQRLREHANDFFNHEGEEPWSYNWICQHLDICPIKTRRLALESSTAIHIRYPSKLYKDILSDED